FSKTLVYLCRQICCVHAFTIYVRNFPDTITLCASGNGNLLSFFGDHSVGAGDLQMLKLAESANNGHVYSTDIITVDQGCCEKRGMELTKKVANLSCLSYSIRNPAIFSLNTKTRQRVLAFGRPRQEEINDIFSKKRNKPEQQNTKKSDKRTHKDSKHDEPVPRREKLSKTGGSNVDMFESKKTARPKKKTADDLVIYSEEELGFGKTDAGVLGSERGIALVCASLDGDVDRFVYFTVISNGNNKINLVDGEKILSLFSLFIKDQLSILIDDKDEYQPRVGHGTILFSNHFLNWLEGRKSTEKGLEKKNGAKRLWAVTKLINQAVGDALSELLLVEAILQHMGWTVDKWNEHYHDLPSRQLKPTQNVISSSSALANSPTFVCPSRTPTSARFGSALNIKTLVAAAEHRETPIDETIKATFSFFVQTLLSVYFHLEKQRITRQSRRALTTYNLAHHRNRRRTTMQISGEFDSDSDVEEDQRTSNEFMADLNVEYHERALLANQKRFYKRSGRVGSARKPLDKTKETCFAYGKLGHFQKDCPSPKTSTPSYPSSNNSFKKSKPYTPSFNQTSSQNFGNHQKDYKGKYKGLKAKIVVLTKRIDDDDESVSSDDKGISKIRAFMAIAEDEPSVRKADARSGQWVDITMKKVHRLFSMTDGDERKHVLDYTHVDLHYVVDQRKNLVSKFNLLKQEISLHKSELSNLKNTVSISCSLQNEVIRVNLENESLKDEIIDLKKVIEKWTCSKVTLDQLVSKQVPSNIVKALGGKGRRKEKISSKEVVFTKVNESSSDLAPEITSDSESECDSQEPLPKLIGAAPSSTSESLISLSDLSLNMADLTLDTPKPKKTRPSVKVSPIYVIKKKTEKSPAGPKPCSDKKADSSTEQLLLTLIEEVKGLKMQIEIPSDTPLSSSQPSSSKVSKQKTWFGPLLYMKHLPDLRNTPTPGDQGLPTGNQNPLKSGFTKGTNLEDYLKRFVLYLDSGCSRHMTGIKQYLHIYSKESGPEVVFRDDSLGDTEGYGLVNCNEITFTMVAYVNGLKHNLISISQLCDANYKVMFTKTQGTIYNQNDEVVLIAPRRRDIYVIDMSFFNKESNAYFFAKASPSVNWLWHKRLSHLNFKNINNLKRHNLVSGLPSLTFPKDKNCSACEKGK
ncbi:retrovirus-related pol polyprotein from transposon TNT 1-94, partial [Tanacetum coccineum]